MVRSHRARARRGFLAVKNDAGEKGFQVPQEVFPAFLARDEGNAHLGGQFLEKDVDGPRQDVVDGLFVHLFGEMPRQRLAVLR